MKKIVVVAALAATSLALTAWAAPAQAGAPTTRTAPATPQSRVASSTADQPWSPWVLTPSDSADITGICTDTLHVENTVDRVRTRTRLVPGGNTEIESKGGLVIELTPASQPDRYARFDISGPSLGASSQVVYLNGDYLFRATGASLITLRGSRVEGTGLPRLAFTRGPIGILVHQTTADVITRPRVVVDVCRYLGLDSVP